MSKVQEDTERMPLEPVFLHFKRFKVAISQAIKRPFPFLAFLRDTELISDKMYKDFQDSCTNLVPVEQVVYRALEELEKRLDEVVLRVLFSEENVRAYPDLEDIITNLQNVSQNRLCSQGSDRGDPNPPLNFEQVLGLPENELSEDPLETVQINQVRRDTTADNTDELERDQATPDAEPEESCVLEVQLSNSDAPMEPHSPLLWNEETISIEDSDDGNNHSEESTSGICKPRAELRSQGTQVYPYSMHMDIKQENSSLVLDGEETQASTSHNQASEAMDLSSEDSQDGISYLEESTSGICKPRAELLIQGTPIYPCSVHLVDIKQKNSSFVLDDEETEASTIHNDASEVIDLSSEDSDDGNNHSEESTSGICKPRAELLIQGTPIYPCSVQLVDIMQENHLSETNSSFVSDSELSEEASTSYNEGSEVIDFSGEDTDDGISCSEESTSGICKPSPRNPRQHNVDFSSPELPVTCGTAKGTLYKKKFEQGTGEKSILSETGEWLTLREFEIKGRRGNSKKWKQSIRSNGRTLKELIEDGYLPCLPRKRRKKENPKSEEQCSQDLSQNWKFNNLGVTVGSQFETTFERTLSINNTGEQPQSRSNHIVLLT
ncbi:nuclear autoantigen Sp-100-like isoform X5 [Cricetulus griseus]|uniref:Nuclear autoantigen Sp-100-like isoform X5 n=1 Tax=Cricetulus griseus TaxID=10029 RepID=A0A9J7GQV0_CRIGR|nr:nuclear autoantigen Sp-100-like isoform X5 [Cricetulus griseus]